MARPIKKNIYERIADKKNEIKHTEELLSRLNNELQDLYKEQDKEEMERMLQQIRANGIDINEALKLLSGKDNNINTVTQEIKTGKNDSVKDDKIKK